MKIEKLLEELKHKTLEQIVKESNSLVECFGNVAYLDTDLYEFLDNIETNDGYLLIEGYRVPTKEIPNRFGYFDNEILVDFNKIEKYSIVNK